MIAIEILAAFIAVSAIALLVAMLTLRIVFWRRAMRDGHNWLMADAAHYSRAQSDAAHGDRLAKLYLWSINLLLISVGAFFVLKIVEWTVGPR